jgi:hypothetical protein
MKKTSLFFAALAMTLCVVYSSCKKTSSSTNPTPSNVRLLSFTKTTSGTILLPLPKYVPTDLRSYAFSYDNSGRVTQIIYSSNDDSEYAHGLANLIMSFTYSGGTVYKKTTRSDYSAVEVDSFIENSSGLVTNAYTPTLNNIFGYTGNLMFSNTIIARDSSGTTPSVFNTMTTVSNITSSGGNFLELTYNGSLAETYSGLTPPITLYYTYLTTTGAGIIPTTNTGTSNSENVTLNNYNREPVSVMAVDDTPMYHDTAYANYPGSIWLTENYTFYGLSNRVGDYFQLGSFVTYGTNIYQNVDLVKSIKNSGFTKTITYTINAQSEITQTNVAITDSLGNTYSEEYNLQYETY